MVFCDKDLRGIFVPKRAVVLGKWIKLHTFIIILY